MILGLEGLNHQSNVPCANYHTTAASYFGKGGGGLIFGEWGVCSKFCGTSGLPVPFEDHAQAHICPNWKRKDKAGLISCLLYDNRLDWLRKRVLLVPFLMGARIQGPLT